MFPNDLAYGMEVARMRAGATGRVARRGLAGPTDMLLNGADAAVQASHDAQHMAQSMGRPGGSNSIMVDPKVDLLDPKGGVTPDTYMGISPTTPTPGMVSTQLAPVGQPSTLERFNALSTPAKVGIGVGGVVAVAGLLWLLKG